MRLRPLLAVLFAQAAGSDDKLDLPMTGGPVNRVMKLIPARCRSKRRSALFAFFTLNCGL